MVFRGSGEWRGTRRTFPSPRASRLVRPARLSGPERTLLSVGESQLSADFGKSKLKRILSICCFRRSYAPSPRGIRPPETANGEYSFEFGLSEIGRKLRLSNTQ